MNRPDQIWLYRITHIQNLEHILNKGLVTASSPNADPNFICIGDNTLIEFRKDLDAHDPPGGKLSEYIPFYLGPRSPMLLQIATGFEGVRKYHQEDIIYVITSLSEVKRLNLQYFFSDGHVRSKTTVTYNDAKYLDELDWDCIYATEWFPTEQDLKRKQKKQAELLVKDQLPTECIQFIGVYNDAAKKVVVPLLQKFNLHSIAVKVSPRKLYYDHL